LGWYALVNRDKVGPLVMTGDVGARWLDPDLAEEGWVVPFCGLDPRASENGVVGLP